MDELTKYEGGALGPVFTEIPQMSEPGSPVSFDMIVSMLLRRWQTIVIVFAVICGIGLPSIWLRFHSIYEVTGAIRVAPILSNILTGEVERGDISNYQSYMDTQAELILSPQVVHRVADELSDKNLSFFANRSGGAGSESSQQADKSKSKPDISTILKKDIAAGIITAVASRGSELMKITMKSREPEEAKKVVDAFLQAYMLVEVENSLQGQDQKLTVLENERKMLSDKIQHQREAIRQMADEYGTTALDGRQDMMLQRVSTILAELTKAEASRIVMEAKEQTLEQGKQQAVMTEELLQKRNEYVNSDLAIKELTRSVVQLEQDIIPARQLMTPQNPLLQQKEEFLVTFKARLEERKREAVREFETRIVMEVNEMTSARLASLKAELEQAQIYESRLREKLAKEDAKTIDIGRKQLAIQDMQYQLNLDKEMFDTVSKRIQGLEMERKRPARISIAYPADIAVTDDKRFKYTLALVFVAMISGIGLAFLKDKADLSLRSPEDITKLIGGRIIGTTTSQETVEKALLPRQLTEDYQTIRANLGLLDEGGMPKKLVVTSAGMRDGKTTFSVNLATSLSRSGRKVLLIDGDLRKPDVGRLLNVPRDMRHLQDVLMGNPFDDSAIAIVSPGLHVLAADSQNTIDPYELLVLPTTALLIDKLAERYDHVIIDTPPVLAFPDALILAKIAGAVILASFAGHTTGPDLKETRDRLAQINVRILGTVMGNVHLGHTYYRYGYHYYAQGGRPRRDSRRNGINPLLLSDKSQDDSDKPAS